MSEGPEDGKKVRPARQGAQIEADNSADHRQACRRCNEKKTRCDKKWPTCSVCARRSLECIYTGAPRRRGPGKSKQHVQQLEQRLRRMEALIQQQESQEGKADRLSFSPGPSEDLSRDETESQSLARGSGRKNSHGRKASDTSSSASVLSHANKKSKLNGHAGASPKTTTLNPANMIDSSLFPTPTNTTQQQTSPQPPIEHIRDRIRQSMGIPSFTAKAFGNVYSNNEIAWFVAPILDEISTQIPVIDVDALVQRIENTPVSSAEHAPAAWTTMIESIIARVVIVRAAADNIPRCYEIAWDQVVGGLERLPLLLLDGSSACDGSSDVVDALLSMALFMRGTADTRTTAMLVSSAIRHHWTLTRHVSSPSSEQTARAHNRARDMASRKIWSLYALDQELSLNHGIPPSTRKADIDTREFPMGPAANGSVVMIDPTYPIHLRPQGVFWARVKLATVQEAIYSRLYSPAGRADSSAAAVSRVILVSARELHDTLRGVAMEVCPSSAATAAHHHHRHGSGWPNDFPFLGLQTETPFPVADVSIVALHFSLYNCAGMIYSAAGKAAAMLESSDEATADGMSLSSSQARLFCLASARSTLYALRSLPPSTLPELWNLLVYPLSAALTILKSVLDSPPPPPPVPPRTRHRALAEEQEESDDLEEAEDSMTPTTEAEEDANLIAQLARYVRALSVTKGYPLERMTSGCDEMARLARIAVAGENGGFSDVAITTTARELLSQATHPMYMAQNLMGNLPTRDQRVSHELAKILIGEDVMAATTPHHMAPFAPDILHLEGMRAI